MSINLIIAERDAPFFPPPVQQWQPTTDAGSNATKPGYEESRIHPTCSGMTSELAYVMNPIIQER